MIHRFDYVEEIGSKKTDFGQYEGDLDKDENICGYGTLTREEGPTYKGMFKNEKCHGFGVEIYDNGIRWEGETFDG